MSDYRVVSKEKSVYLKSGFTLELYIYSKAKREIRKRKTKAQLENNKIR
jgi:hypothetical protein